MSQDGGEQAGPEQRCCGQQHWYLLQLVGFLVVVVVLAETRDLLLVQSIYLALENT